MKKLAIDCRMSGKSGIGSYFDALLPFFKEHFDCIFINPDIKPFSLKELFSFPKEELEKINSCDYYYTPYCNIPSGIKIPIFSTIHDIVFLDIPLASKAGTFARKLFYKRAVKKSKLIFTVSEFSKQRIIRHLKPKIPVIVTYNASDIQNSVLKKKSETKNLQKLQNTFLFVGNIKKHKGLHVLLDAFKTVLKSIPDAKLIIAGNSENFRTGDETIQTEIEKIGDSVKFTGFISNDELLSLYQTVSTLVQPSFYEGFGMPPLEALSCKTNVVLSDIDVFKEIYSGFPVTFFKTGDSQDLSEKMISSLSQNPPENIPDKYSFEKTFNIISENLK